MEGKGCSLDRLNFTLAWFPGLWILFRIIYTVYWIFWGRYERKVKVIEQVRLEYRRYYVRQKNTIYISYSLSNNLNGSDFNIGVTFFGIQNVNRMYYVYVVRDTGW